GQLGRARQPVEVKPRVQLAGATQPFSAERNLVSASIDHGAARNICGLDLVALILGRAAGDQMEHKIPRVTWLALDTAAAMIPHASPMAADAIIERPILNELDGCAAGIFD